MLSNNDPLVSSRVVVHDFLDESECVETVRRIHRLQGRWTTRSEFGDFFTLGAAAYLDAGESPEVYQAAAAQTNPSLREVFGDLYSGLHGFLESLLAEPVAYDGLLAMPGFHIFGYDGRVLPDDNIGERAHFDMQFRNIGLGWAPEATLSFTLPLQQPPGGSGLAVWSLDYEDAVRRDMHTRSWAAQNPWTLVDYEMGRMVLHDGLMLHAIIKSPKPAPKGLRITLQGHGVRHDGRWTIYW